MFLAPVLGDFAPGAEPDPFPRAGMLEKLDQPDRSRWAPDQPIVEIDRQHRGPLDPLLVEQVERVDHVVRKPVGGAEARIAVETVVVGLIGARDHEMVAAAGFDPERQFVAEIVAIVEEAAVLDEKPPRIVARSTAEPPDRRLSRELFDAFDAQSDML